MIARPNPRIVKAAVQEEADVIGLSVSSGIRLDAVMEPMTDAFLQGAPSRRSTAERS